MNLNPHSTIETEIHTDVFSEKVLIRPDTIYAWTIAPDDKHQYLGVRRPKSLGAKTRLQSVQDSFAKVFTELEISNIEFYLVTEFTEPFTGKTIAQIPRIHYHGYIYFPDVESILGFLQYDALDLSTKCMQTIKPLTDKAKWSSYLTKHQFLGIKPITSNNYSNIEMYASLEEVPKAPSPAGTVRSIVQEPPVGVLGNAGRKTRKRKIKMTDDKVYENFVKTKV